MRVCRYTAVNPSPIRETVMWQCSSLLNNKPTASVVITTDREMPQASPRARRRARLKCVSANSPILEPSDLAGYRGATPIRRGGAWGVPPRVGVAPNNTNERSEFLGVRAKAGERASPSVTSPTGNALGENHPKPAAKRQISPAEGGFHTRKASISLARTARKFHGDMPGISLYNPPNLCYNIV